MKFRNKSSISNNSIYAIIILYHVLILSFIFFENKSFPGSESYSHIADNWLETGKYSRDGENFTFYRPPLYPLMLVISKIISSSHWEVIARLIQCLLSIICSILIFKIVIKISGSTWASFIALSLYLFNFLLQMEHYVQRETVLFELMVLLYCYVIIYYNSFRINQIVYLALISAGLYLTRPTGLLFLLTGFALIFIFEKELSRKIKLGLTFVIIFCVLIFPWQLYQFQAFSKISLSSSNTSGLNLYKGASPAIQSIYPEIDVDEAKSFIVEQIRKHGIDPNDEYRVNSFLTEEAFIFMKKDPLFFVKNMVVKLFAFYSPVVLPLGKGDLDYSEEKITLKNFKISFDWRRLNYMLISLVIIPCGIIEAFQKKNRNGPMDRFKAFSILIFILFTFVHVITFAETRFRLPLDGLLCMLSGVFIYRSKELIFNKFKLNGFRL